MALLIPLLLPHVLEAATNIGIGVTNAIQGTNSNVTLQLGSKVFSTRKKFNFLDLPYELRQTIVLMALEMSKDLILPTAYSFDPRHPVTDTRLRELQKRHPLHPDNENYRSIMGDQISANDYPISSWRWMRVSREWREMLQAALWAQCDVTGYRRYQKLIQFIDKEQGRYILPMIRTIKLQEGFSSPSDIYTILSDPRLTSLEEISFLPDWPFPAHPFVQPVTPFPFGLQLIRTKKPIKRLTYGLPLEMTTNEASRQHLQTLSAPRLDLSFARPTLAIFEELKTLVSECTLTLGLRYVTNRISIEPDLLLCEPLQSFSKIVLQLQLPKPVRSIVTPFGVVEENDPDSATKEFINRLVSALERAEEEVQERYTVYNVTEQDRADGFKRRIRLWPVVEQDLISILPPQPILTSAPAATEKDSSLEAQDAVSAHSSMPSEPRRSSERSQWERQTNLKLLGGLINLSLESKKY